MSRRVKAAVALAGLAASAASAGGADTAGAAPTCSTTLGIAVHGQHIVGDYVVGSHVAWPPAGAVGGSGGAALPGGPGPTFHFANGFAPGASFCLSQSSSPGMHPGGG